MNDNFWEEPLVLANPNGTYEIEGYQWLFRYKEDVNYVAWLLKMHHLHPEHEMGAKINQVLVSLKEQGLILHTYLTCGSNSEGYKTMANPFHNKPKENIFTTSDYHEGYKTPMIFDKDKWWQKFKDMSKETGMPVIVANPCVGKSSFIERKVENKATIKATIDGVYSVNGKKFKTYNGAIAEQQKMMDNIDKKIGALLEHKFSAIMMAAKAKMIAETAVQLPVLESPRSDWGKRMKCRLRLV